MEYTGKNTEGKKTFRLY